MARRRHSPEQIVRKLREADRLLGESADVAAVAPAKCSAVSSCSAQLSNGSFPTAW